MKRPASRGPKNLNMKLWFDADKLRGLNWERLFDLSLLTFLIVSIVLPPMILVESFTIVRMWITSMLFYALSLPGLYIINSILAPLGGNEVDLRVNEYPNAAIYFFMSWVAFLICVLAFVGIWRRKKKLLPVICILVMVVFISSDSEVERDGCGFGRNSIMEMATRSQDATVCDGFSGWQIRTIEAASRKFVGRGWSQDCRRGCYRSVGAWAKNAGVCLDIKDISMRFECLSATTIVRKDSLGRTYRTFSDDQMTDVSICEAVRIHFQPHCITDYARVNKDASICGKIETSYEKGICLEKASAKSNDIPR